MSNVVKQKETAQFTPPSIGIILPHDDRTSSSSVLSDIRLSKSMRAFSSEEEIQKVLGKQARILSHHIEVLSAGGSRPNLKFLIPDEYLQKVQTNGCLYNATQGYYIDGFADTLGEELLATPEIISVRVVPGRMLCRANSKFYSFRLDHDDITGFFLIINWSDPQRIRQSGKSPLLPVDSHRVLYSRRTTGRNNKNAPLGEYGTDFYILSMDYAPLGTDPSQVVQIERQRQQLLMDFFQDDSLYQPFRRTTHEITQKTKLHPDIELQEKAFAEKVEEVMAYKNEPMDYLIRFYRLEPFLEKIGGRRVCTKGPANRTYSVKIPWIDENKAYSFATTETDYSRYLKALEGWIDMYLEMVHRNEERAQAILERIYALEEAKKLRC